MADDEVHLWRANLTVSEARLAALAATLTEDEQARAARFRFPEHRGRFIAGRGLLRELLSVYLNIPAAALRFDFGLRGKPTLAGEQRDAGLHFNLSHSGDQALYAVARREVGVDLEALDRQVDYAAVAKRICTRREWVALQALSPKDISEAFFACWTRKEAVAKAIGDGLASGLDTLDICFPEDAAPDGRVSLCDATGQEWSVLNVPMASGWAGALAAAGTDWRWTPA
ncbi:MAG TPA: 4'-phosphopantetheinyl transferase [Gammaproteobacteria bacterium]|nr:4'-phosphopantetheinyl transferase [Gammaproteobacteria bacterium]